MAEDRTFRKEFSDIGDVLEVNRPLQVVIHSEKKKFVYKSSVADFDRGSIIITPMTRDGKPANLRNGEKAEFIYFARNAMYEFKSTVTGRRKENNIILTIIEKPHSCWKIQRREFFRLKFHYKAVFQKAVLKKDENGKKLYDVYDEKCPCDIVDLSGGGVSFTTPEVFEDESYVLISFTLYSEDETVSLKEVMKIIRLKKTRYLNKDECVYTYGASFVDVDEELRSQIIRFIMRKQIEMRNISKNNE